MHIYSFAHPPIQKEITKNKKEITKITYFTIKIMDTGTEKKSSLSLGKILIIIIILALAIIVMQKNGMKVLKTVEKSEITDNPHSGN